MKYCLSINPIKSKVMLFGPKSARWKCLELVNIQVNNNFALTDISKNLGLYMDYNLRYSSYVNHLLKTAQSSLRLIYINHKILNAKIRTYYVRGWYSHI